MITHTGRRLLAISAAVAFTGCGGNTLESMGDVLGTVLGQPAGAGGQNEATVEIRSVDTRQQRLEVATQDGRTGAVRYDQNTVVIYRDQRHPVTALERGDIVRMQLQDVQGTLYTPRIDVQQSVQERTGTGTGAGQVVQLSGRVEQIDHNAGTFVVRTQSGNITVVLPYNTPQATVDYFHRLRRGDSVRLEATQAGSGRVQIYRFL